MQKASSYWTLVMDRQGSASFVDHMVATSYSRYD